MKQLDLNSARVSSRRLGRAITLLQRVFRQVESACQAAPNRYHKDQLHRLLVDLKALSAPIEGLASLLEHRGNR